jgi:hypothetical protein
MMILYVKGYTRGVGGCLIWSEHGIGVEGIREILAELVQQDNALLLLHQQTLRSLRIVAGTESREA